MRAVLVVVSLIFSLSLLLLAPSHAASTPPTSHINQGWAKTICCKKDANILWSTDRQCRLMQGTETKDKACHDADAKVKACCKKEAKTWWSNRRDCRRTGIVVIDTLCKKA